MPPQPLLVQFGDLTPQHLADHPVWIQCHTVDYDEPWYDDTDEETFRPWTGALPAGPEEGMLLVAADLTLSDGTMLPGFLTPAASEEAGGPAILGTIQPQIFLPSGRRESFWDGAVPRQADARNGLYVELGRAREHVFPIRYAAKPGLTTGLASGAIDGFYSQTKLGSPPKVAK